MHKCIIAGLLAVSLALFSGCASNTSFLNARPVEKGKINMYAGLSNINFTDYNPDPVLGEVPEGFFFELGAEAGLTERLSVGFKYTFPTAGSIDGKFTYLGKGRETGFFGALGLHGGYTAFPSADDSVSNDRVEFCVPLYFSYFPLKWLGFTLTPAYSGRFFTQIEEIYSNLVGANFNIKLGNRFGVVLEASFYRNFTYEWNEIQGGIAFNYTLEDLF